jgi:hypothetical protein
MRVCICKGGTFLPSNQVRAITLTDDAIAHPLEPMNQARSYSLSAMIHHQWFVVGIPSFTNESQ